MNWRRLLGLLALFGMVQAGRATSLICQLTPGTDPAEIVAAYGVSFVEQAPHGPFYLFEVSPEYVDAVETAMTSDTRVVWRDLDEDVALAEADVTSKGGTIAVVGDPSAIYAQNADMLRQIGWSPLVAAGGLPVKVAILDTGISPYATSILSSVLTDQNQIFTSLMTADLPDSLYADDDPMNAGAGHGTFVAGLIHSLAPKSQLIIERVADNRGIATTWSIIRGLSDAVYQGARLINISLGTTNDIMSLQRTFGWAKSYGALSVAPIGNGANQGSLFPAEYDGVVCVAGVDSTDRKADFSNWGARADLCAPATGIKSTFWDGNLAIWSGTSFAAPQITAALTIAISKGSALSNELLVERLVEEGKSIESLNPGYPHKLGRRIDFHKLMSKKTRRGKLPENGTAP